MPKTQLPALVTDPTSAIVAMWRQDRRLGTFCTLAEECPDEARANLPASLREALPMLVDHAVAQSAPADHDALTLELTRCLANGMGGPMKEKERTEWQLSLVADLQEIPADLAIEALRKARQTCTRAAEVLPFVFSYVEDLPARRRARLRQLITLADVVGVPIE